MDWLSILKRAGGFIAQAIGLLRGKGAPTQTTGTAGSGGIGAIGQVNGGVTFNVNLGAASVASTSASTPEPSHIAIEILRAAVENGCNILVATLVNSGPHVSVGSRNFSGANVKRTLEELKEAGLIAAIDGGFEVTAKGYRLIEPPN